MIQQYFAILIIVFFLFRLFLQRHKKQISINEFFLWFIFWFIAGVLILFIKKIDLLVLNFGFSSKGIDFLFYLSVVILFYFVFKLRIKIEKQQKEITKLVREIALKEKK